MIMSFQILLLILFVVLQILAASDIEEIRLSVDIASKNFFLDANLRLTMIRHYIFVEGAVLGLPPNVVFGLCIEPAQEDEVCHTKKINASLTDLALIESDFNGNLHINVALFSKRLYNLDEIDASHFTIRYMSDILTEQLKLSTNVSFVSFPIACGEIDGSCKSTIPFTERNTPTANLVNNFLYPMETPSVIPLEASNKVTSIIIGNPDKTIQGQLALYVSAEEYESIRIFGEIKGLNVAFYSFSATFDGYFDCNHTDPKNTRKLEGRNQIRLSEIAVKNASEPVRIDALCSRNLCWDFSDKRAKKAFGGRIINRKLFFLMTDLNYKKCYAFSEFLPQNMSYSLMVEV